MTFGADLVENGLNAQQVNKVLGCYRHHMDSMKNSETNKRKSELLQLLMERHPWLKLTNLRSTYRIDGLDENKDAPPACASKHAGLFLQPWLSP